VAAAAASDYQVADSNVEAGAAVNTVLALMLQDNTPVPVAGPDIAASVELGPGGAVGPAAGDVFTPTDTSLWGQTPILDSYLFNDGNGAGGTSTRQVKVTGLEELATGSNFNVVLWGVGDSSEGDGQDTQFSVAYAGGSATGTTEQSGPLSATYESFTFSKVDGVDELLIEYSNANAGGPFAQNFGAFGGFSITGSTIPEPASMALAALGCLALAARRVRR